MTSIPQQITTQTTPPRQPTQPRQTKQATQIAAPERSTANLQALQTLRMRLQDCESLHRAQHDDYISSGCEALDQLLPQSQHGKGFRTGQLIEWLAAGPGSGVEIWGLHVAIQALRHSQQSNTCDIPKSIAIIDRDRTFYPPAAAALGVDLQRLVIIQPRSDADVIWALDQTLRCPRIAAAWTNLPRLVAKDARRLQLAAEEGGSLGIFSRPLTARGQPSWADVQIQVEPLPFTNTTNGPLNRQLATRQWRLRLLRCRGSQPDQSLTVNLPCAA